MRSLAVKKIRSAALPRVQLAVTAFERYRSAQSDIFMIFFMLIEKLCMGSF